MGTSLVTGGAGFIGSHLVRGLLAQGDRVRVLDNFSTGNRENLAEVGDRTEVVEGDLRDAAAVAEAVKGVDRVFHQAAEVSVPRSVDNPAECLDINVRGTFQLMEAACNAGCRRMVIASSCSVYGENERVPLGEQEVPAPMSPYAVSKLVTEQYAGYFTRASDLGVASLRYFNVFGPKQSKDSDYAAVVPIFCHRLLHGAAPTIYGDGKQSRDFVFVEDVVRANLLASEHPDAPGRVFNVCSGREASLLDLLTILADITASRFPPTFEAARRGDIYRSAGDPTTAERGMEFRAEVTLEEGLRHTVEWMYGPRWEGTRNR